MAGRHAERSKSRCNSVSPVPKGKLARQIYLRARYSASGISGQRFVKRGNKGAPLKSSQQIGGMGVAFPTILVRATGPTPPSSFLMLEWCISRGEKRKALPCECWELQQLAVSLTSAPREAVEAPRP